MAAGDITVEVKVSGTLVSGDAVAAFDESRVFASTADYYDRTLTVPTSEATILQIGTVAGATLAALNCLVVYNLDAANYLTLGIKATGAKSVYFKILAGRLLVLTSSVLECDDDAGAAFAAFSNVDIITLQANTGAVKTRVVAL